MTSKIKGLDALNKKLKRIPVDAKAEIQKALNEGADRIVILSRSLAPRDSGDLVSSIRKQPGRHELAVDVVAGGQQTMREVREGSGIYYDYAMAQEFGTENHPANPFFYPAWRALKKSIRARLSKAYRDAAKKGGTGSAS